MSNVSEIVKNCWFSVLFCFVKNVLMNYFYWKRLEKIKCLFMIIKYNNLLTFPAVPNGYSLNTLRRPQNFAKSTPYFWLALHRTKVRWRFRKILWPSQNIWTLCIFFMQCRHIFLLQCSQVLTYIGMLCIYDHIINVTYFYELLLL